MEYLGSFRWVGKGYYEIIKLKGRFKHFGLREIIAENGIQCNVCEVTGVRFMCGFMVIS